MSGTMTDMTDTRATATKASMRITVDRDLLTRVSEEVSEGKAPSVSAYIEHAVARQLDAEAGFDATIAEMLASTGGPATDEERSAARRLLSTSAA